MKAVCYFESRTFFNYSCTFGVFVFSVECTYLSFWTKHQPNECNVIYCNTRRHTLQQYLGLSLQGHWVQTRSSVSPAGSRSGTRTALLRAPRRGERRQSGGWSGAPGGWPRCARCQPVTGRTGPRGRLQTLRKTGATHPPGDGEPGWAVAAGLVGGRQIRSAKRSER